MSINYKKKKKKPSLQLLLEMNKKTSEVSQQQKISNFDFEQQHRGETVPCKSAIILPVSKENLGLLM